VDNHNFGLVKLAGDKTVEERITTAGNLTDQIVYKLYGLTPEEIKLVDA